MAKAIPGAPGDRVYVDDPVDYYDQHDGPRNRILVFDTSGGDLRATDTQTLWDDRRARPRALVKSNTYRTGEVVDVDGDGRGDGRAGYG